MTNLTIRPFGGLGNRIRVLHSALSLKKEANVNLKIIWDYKTDFKCSIYNLFNVPDYISVVEKPFIHWNSLEKYFKNSSFLSLAGKQKYDLILLDKDIIKHRNEGFNFKGILNHSNVYVETCQWFFSGDKRLLMLEPKNEIIDTATSITSKFSDYTIGIHIRRTDHKLSKVYSPLNEFRKVVKREISKNINATFFLATDSKDTEEELIREFGHLVITRSEKELSRNNPKGITDGFIDMLCLAKTKKIYGSYSSSFSEIASFIYGTEFEVVKTS